MPFAHSLGRKVLAPRRTEPAHSIETCRPTQVPQRHIDSLIAACWARVMGQRGTSAWHSCSHCSKAAPGCPHESSSSRDQHNAEPVVDMELALEDDDGQQAREDDQSPSQHLEDRGKGVEQANIEQRGGPRVADGWQAEEERSMQLGCPGLLEEAVLATPHGSLPPGQQPKGYEAQHLSQEHCCRLEGRVVKQPWPALCIVSDNCDVLQVM